MMGTLWAALSTTKENIFPLALTGRLWEAGGTMRGPGNPWDQLLCTGAGQMPGWKGVCGGEGDWFGCWVARGGCGLGQGAGSLIHGKETCRGRQEGQGRLRAAGVVFTLLSRRHNCCPRFQRISHFSQEALPDSPQIWDGGPHHGSPCTLSHHHVLGTAFVPGTQSRDSHALPHLIPLMLCDEPEAEQDLVTFPGSQVW